MYIYSSCVVLMVLNLDQTTGADVIQLTTSYITTIVGGSRKELNVVHSVELQTMTRYLNQLFYVRQTWFKHASIVIGNVHVGNTCTRPYVFPRCYSVCTSGTWRTSIIAWLKFRHAYNIQQWKCTVLDFMHTILHHLATKSHQDSMFVPLELSMIHRT